MRRFGRFLSLTLALGMVGASVWALFNHQTVYDWTRLIGYTPPATIDTLATHTTMNDSTRRLFYVQHPELDDRSAFNQHCGHFGEVTIVLGCYISGQGLYIFNVDDDPRLDGVKEVTAAHEMLHAAYDRLSQEERSRVDLLTEQAFANLADQRIRDNIASYRERDPSVVPNELHSILGTEVRQLPPELDAYYQRYFINRAQIVDYSERYEGELTKRRTAATTLENQIASLQNEIAQLKENLQTERSSLERLRPTINTEEEVAIFNNRVETYNANIVQLNNLIEQHNTLVEEYKSNALEQQQLFKALSSQPSL